MKNKIKILSVSFIALLLTSCYDFNRQQAEKDAESKGKQILLEAESSKKAMIEEAKAKNEAANMEAEAKIKRAHALSEEKIILAKGQAQAEIERAKGIAEANKIIGESLKGNIEYLKYLMIDAIANGKGERIYVPTEAGLPILEAK